MYWTTKIVKGNGRRVITDSGQIVCTLDNARMDDENNARRIARVPLMEIALAAALEALEGFGTEDEELKGIINRALKYSPR